MIPRLADDPEAPFPPVAQAETEADGLLAWGGDLHPRRLLNAYRQGIFPWYSPGQPLLWWWPQPRTVLYPGQLHISRRLRRRLRQDRYTVRADTAFSEVIGACSRPENAPAETWIDAAMTEAYCTMHELGYAHSVEVWEAGLLVGGIYGISLGGVFFGESMFSARRDTSKIAMAWLCAVMKERDFLMLDCQLPNDHLYRLGARDVPGPEFADLLDHAVQMADPIPDWPAAFSVARSW